MGRHHLHLIHEALPSTLVVVQEELDRDLAVDFVHGEIDVAVTTLAEYALE
jgi:DNA-binding transcriptional LysR family regulator